MPFSAPAFAPINVLSRGALGAVPRALGPAMLSIGKLGRGAEGYYLQAVAAGVEDYYLGSG